MARAILTLQYPQGLKGLPIATSTNINALRFFKQCVLEDWHRKIELSQDEAEAMLYRLEFQRLKTALNIFIPDETNGNEESDRGQSPVA